MKTIFKLLPAFLLIAACEQKSSSSQAEMTTTAQHADDEIFLNESQQRLANIKVAVAERKQIGQTIKVNGELEVNEELTEIISARATGRVEKLYLKETGRMVEKGEPLYELYSEQLLTLQREYLLAVEQWEKLGESEPRYASIVKASAKKLLLFGLSQAQIDRLRKSKTIQSRITFLAPATGLVTEISVSEGEYVVEGASLYKLENISSLWAELELYPSEIKFLKIGDKLNLRVTGFEKEQVQGTVSFFSPEYKANTQITRVRAVLNNPQRKFKPGMQVQAYFSHSSHVSLAVPTDAIIRDAHGAHLYVITTDNTFQPRPVETGTENFDQVEILTGLQPGEKFAASGAYLLYSELILKKGVNLSDIHRHAN